LIISINKDIQNHKKRASDYHDFAYLSYVYSDLLANDMNIKPKTSKLNPRYWLDVSRHDEWSSNKKIIL